MSSFVKLWRGLCVKHANLSNPENTVEMKVKQFEKLLLSVYTAGTRDKARLIKELESFRKDGMSNLLDKILK